jgi:hypothetical protein
MRAKVAVKKILTKCSALPRELAQLLEVTATVTHGLLGDLVEAKARVLWRGGQLWGEQRPESRGRKEKRAESRGQITESREQRARDYLFLIGELHLNDLPALIRGGEVEEEGTGQTPQDGEVDVERTVGGSKDSNRSLIGGGEAVPQAHELTFHRAGRFVVGAAPFPEKQVDLIQEDDGGRTLPGEGEEGAHKLLALPEPLVLEGGLANVNEGRTC